MHETKALQNTNIQMNLEIEFSLALNLQKSNNYASMLGDIRPLIPK